MRLVKHNRLILERYMVLIMARILWMFFCLRLLFFLFVLSHRRLFRFNSFVILGRLVSWLNNLNSIWYVIFVFLFCLLHLYSSSFSLFLPSLLLFGSLFLFNNLLLLIDEILFEFWRFVMLILCLLRCLIDFFLQILDILFQFGNFHCSLQNRLRIFDRLQFFDSLIFNSCLIVDLLDFSLDYLH